MEFEFDEIKKCIIIGDQYVGKSSICRKLVKKDFSYEYQSTIGVDFFIKIFNINNKNIKLQIWDTAGQEKYKAITSSYYNNARLILFVFDLNNESSFLNLKKWIDNVDNYCDDNIKKILIGNKSDLQCFVNESDILKFTYQNNLEYYECSAKLDNIDNLFFEILSNNIIDTKYNNNTINTNYDNNIIRLNVNNKKCCDIL